MKSLVVLKQSCDGNRKCEWGKRRLRFGRLGMVRLSFQGHWKMEATERDLDPTYQWRTANWVDTEAVPSACAIARWCSVNGIFGNALEAVPAPSSAE